MADPNTDLFSKIPRAVRAVLLDQGAVTIDNCYISLDSRSRTLPNTTIEVQGDGASFDGPGNFRFPAIVINLRDDAIVQPDEADPNGPRTRANARCTAIYNALCRSDDTHTLDYTAREITRLGQALAVDASSGSDPVQAQFAADNSDMGDFCVMLWELEQIGAPKKTEDGTFWEREMVFSCVACNANLTP
jgi:hypothetical protein